MTPTKMFAFAQELTKIAKPSNLGTLLGQNVTKTVKVKTKGVTATRGSKRK